VVLVPVGAILVRQLRLEAAQMLFRLVWFWFGGSNVLGPGPVRRILWL
jgi:hypothetical protein